MPTCNLRDGNTGFAFSLDQFLKRDKLLASRAATRLVICSFCRSLCLLADGIS